MRNSHGALRKLAAAHPFFSGLQVSTVSSQLPPALFGTQRWQSRASPENQEIEDYRINSVIMWPKCILGQNSIYQGFRSFNLDVKEWFEWFV